MTCIFCFELIYPNAFFLFFFKLQKNKKQEKRIPQEQYAELGTKVVCRSPFYQKFLNYFIF